MKIYFVLQLLCLAFSIINAQSSEYTLTSDVNIGSSLQQSALIASYNTQSSVLCLGACNRNPNCLSCSYNKDATTTSDDCYLYNQIFVLNDYLYANNVNWYSKKGTTQSKIAIPSGCNCSLMFYFTNTTLNSSITSYNGVAFGSLFSTEMAIVNNTPVYFFADWSGSALIKMSETWQYITKVNTISMPRVIKWANDHLYVSSDNGFHKMDYNLNIKKSIADTSARYNGIYANASDDTVVVAVWGRKRLDWIDANLTVLSTITLGTYSPVAVAGYGDSLYVSAFNVSISTVIYVIRNKAIANTLSISPTVLYIYSIVFDDYGYMALTFVYELRVSLYHINGTSTGLSFTLPYQTFRLNFDFNRRMMITTRNALYFFN